MTDGHLLEDVSAVPNPAPATTPPGVELPLVSFSASTVSGEVEVGLLPAPSRPDSPSPGAPPRRPARPRSPQTDESHEAVVTRTEDIEPTLRKALEAAGPGARLVLTSRVEK